MRVSMEFLCQRSLYGWVLYADLILYFEIEETRQLCSAGGNVCDAVCKYFEIHLGPNNNMSSRRWSVALIKYIKLRTFMYVNDPRLN